MSNDLRKIIELTKPRLWPPRYPLHERIESSQRKYIECAGDEPNIYIVENDKRFVAKQRAHALRFTKVNMPTRAATWRNKNTQAPNIETVPAARGRFLVRSMVRVCKSKGVTEQDEIGRLAHQLDDQSRHHRCH